MTKIFAQGNLNLGKGLVGKKKLSLRPKDGTREYFKLVRGLNFKRKAENGTNFIFLELPMKWME